MTDLLLINWLQVRVLPESFVKSTNEWIFVFNEGVVSPPGETTRDTDVNVTAAYYAVFSSDELAAMQEKHSPLLNMLEEDD